MFLKTKLNESDLRKLDDIMRGAPIVSAPLDSRIDAVMMDLSVRTRNCLVNENIETLDDLVRKSEAELLRTPNFGRKGLKELQDELARLGRYLGELPRKPPATS